MMTQTHVLLGSAIFSRKAAIGISIAAIIGGLLPDFPMYPFTLAVIIGGWEWEANYWSNWVQYPMGLANSIPLYLIVIGIGVWLKKPWLWALGGAALLHCLGDLPLHHNDGHMHFFPFSDFRFQSPVSYYDPRHYANWWRPVEVVIGLACCYILARRHPVLWNRILMAVLAVLYLALLLLPLFFDGPRN